MEKQAEKLALQKERVEAAKMEVQEGIIITDTAKIKAILDASLWMVGKMKEDVKMLTAYLSGMSPAMRACHEFNQQCILRKIGRVPP